MDVSSLLESFRENESLYCFQFNNVEGLTSWRLPQENSPLVDLIPSPGVATHSSPYLKLKSLVNSSWPNRMDPGRSVAVHMKGLYYAHVTAIYDAKESSLGAVRVVNRESDERILIKGIQGKVVDIAFAHLNVVIIGCVDELGDLYVYSISEGTDKKLQSESLLQLKYERTRPSKYNLISWCPFMLDNDRSKEGLESSFLAVSHNTTSEIISIKSVIREHGVGPLIASKVTHGRLKLEDRKNPITAIQISPDGTAVATASSDGVIKFFQIYFASNETPRCLHSWTPNGNKEVSSLFFLDDLTEKNRSKDYWSYAITGFNDNKELMLWCCNDWSPIQVIRFNCSMSVLKASLDLTSRYLLLSDIVKMNLYVFRIELDSQTRIVSVSEFATLNPFFSISILDAGIKKLGDLHIKDTTLSDDEDDFDDEDTPEVLNVENSREATVIQFYLAYPRGLQECRIVYNDATGIEHKESNAITSSSLENELIAKPLMKSPTFPSISPSVKGESSSSPSKLDTAAKQISMISPEMMNGIKKQPPISGGSSPSREVQDILGDSNHDLGEDVVVTEENCPYDDEDETDEIEEDEKGVVIDDMLKQFQKMNKSVDWPSENRNTSNSIVLSKSFDLTSSSVKAESTPLIQKASSSSSTIASVNVNGVDYASKSNNNAMDPVNSSEALMKKMDEIMNFLQKDRDDIKKLREEVKELKKMKSDSKVLNQRFRDHEKFITTKVQSSIKAEMQAASSNLLAVYKKESKETLSKAIQSKHFLDSIAGALSEALHPMIQDSFKETFVSIIIPAFERSCQNILSQISSTFNKGVKDYDSTVKSHLKEVIGNEQSLLIRELKDSIYSFNSGLEKYNSTKKDENDRLLNEVKKVIQDVLSRSASTPSRGEIESASKSDVILHQIQLLLNASKYNEAFKVALSSNSLPIAVATCQMVDPGVIFGEDKCPLEQSVILALIQHCATDLEEHTALKLSYLEEAIMNVDPNYPPLEANASVFVSKVVQSMQNYITAHPNTKFSKSLKLRLMAVKSFVKD